MVGRHRVRRHDVQRVRVFRQVGLQAPHIGLEPLLVRLAHRQHLVDVFRAQQRAGFGVHRQNLAGTQTPLLHDLGGLVVVDADFGSQRDVPVRSDHVARRTQAVAIQAAGRVAAIGQHHAGRTVPGLHVHGIVFVEGAHVGIQILDVLPGRRDHRAQRRENVHATRQQHLQHVVQALRIRAAHVHQRRDFLDVRNLGALELLGARHRPLAVAGNRVDLAVVREIAERVAQRPLRQGVGRETLMEHAHRGFERRVRQVRIEIRQKLRHHQALVDDHAARQRGHIELGVTFTRQNLLGATTRLEQLELERELVRPLGRGDEDLFDLRLGFQGLFAER